MVGGTIKMRMTTLKKTFKDLYQATAERAFFAPGRINLIGEHTDYNGGHVFPCAITYGTYGIARKRHDQRIRMFSLNFKEKGFIEFQLDHLEYTSSDNWGNYPKGMIHYIQEAGWVL